MCGEIGLPDHKKNKKKRETGPTVILVGVRSPVKRQKSSCDCATGNHTHKRKRKIPHFEPTTAQTYQIRWKICPSKLLKNKKGKNKALALGEKKERKKL